MRKRHVWLCVFSIMIFAGTAWGAQIQVPAGSQIPTPSIPPGSMRIDASAMEAPYSAKGPETQGLFGAPPLITSFPGFSMITVAQLTGYLFIPPDPHCAVGRSHVIDIGNVCIQWHTKAGVTQSTQTLAGFFGPIGPPLGTFCFDPKVIYDQYADRFVVVCLEQWDSAYGDPSDESRILLAVSKTGDPNAGWWYTQINAKTTISGIPTWSDYPGFAVDDKAVYVTSNMYNFASYAGVYGVRLWIVDKGLAAGFYAGGAAAVTKHDPYATTGGLALTTQPTHMFGVLPATWGTFLVGYSGLYDGLQEYVQVVQVTNPLGAVTFGPAQFIPVGPIENPTVALPDAPQLGSAALIEVNDRRALNAVWRDNELAMGAEILPTQGADAGQTTAHWWLLRTTLPAAVTLLDQGNIGGEDIAPEATTFFPAVMLDWCDNLGVGFSLSAPSIYCGAYYTGRLKNDPAGTVQPTGALAPGTDWYVRTFGGPRNRWGDYSGIALDPVDDNTMWIFNEYTSLRGYLSGGEDGRWSTQVGSFKLTCPTTAVAVTRFDAIATTEGVELMGSFVSDSDFFRVNVYRGDPDSPFDPAFLTGFDNTDRTSFRFTDSSVEPGRAYRYRVGVVDRDGEYLSPIVDVHVPTMRLVLEQNSPNPFNPTTTIRFVLPAKEHVRLAIYDTGGRLVRTLADEVRGRGPNELLWDGLDNNGSAVSSGVYFYRLEAGKVHESKKMLLLK
jgi:hypothetical protein